MTDDKGPRTNDLLSAVAEVYAAAPTYRDSGAVVTRTFTPDDRLMSERVQPFETAFVRPGQFRFEYRERHRQTDHWNRRVVWMDGPDVRRWSDVTHRAEAAGSLGLALAVRMPACGAVPALLLPAAVRGGWLCDLVGVAEVPDDGVAGVPCHRLTASRPSDEAINPGVVRVDYSGAGFTFRTPDAPVTLWVDRATLLLRRAECWGRFDPLGLNPGYQTHEVLTYDPEAGGEVAVEELRFGAPDPDLE